ncbi:prephenate dehydrogenase/arogenate dehydrogenase family protein, partial [bacterium]
IKASGMAGEVVGSDSNGEALQKALDLGILDNHLPPTLENLRESDLVVLAIPVLQLARMLKEGFAPGTLVTDVGSVKLPLVRAYKEACRQGSDYGFVPGHPIAGDEKSGPQAARKGLFDGARVILTPIRETDPQVEKITAMWSGIGAKIQLMEAEYHDEVFAWVSHLPHMAAYSIVQSVLEKDRSWISMSGGGLKDYTRIAASNPGMWADIAVANRELLLEAMTGLRTGLQEIYSAIESGDRDSLEELFMRIAEARREMK